VPGEEARGARFVIRLRRRRPTASTELLVTGMFEAADEEANKTAGEGEQKE
jgi:hypothetical protein